MWQVIKGMTMFSVVCLITYATSELMRYAHEETERRSWLHDDPYAWLSKEWPFAVPINVSKQLQFHNAMEHTHIRYSFYLRYPAGYTEFIIVPEHTEVCSHTGNYSELSCKPLKGEEGYAIGRP